MRTEGGPEDVTILPCRLSLPSQERVAGLARAAVTFPNRLLLAHGNRNSVASQLTWMSEGGVGLASCRFQTEPNLILKSLKILVPTIHPRLRGRINPWVAGREIHMKETAFLFQAVLVLLWWLGLLASPTFFDAFQFEGISAVAFWSFFIPDVILIAALSGVRAYYRQTALEYLILGAFAYATLYCCNAAILTQSGFLATGLMVLGSLYNLFIILGHQLFRTSTAGLVQNALKTAVQITCIWLLALVVIPFLILDAFGADTKIDLTGWTVASGGLLMLSSLLGLYASYAMVRYGNGTPLPLDQSRQLVLVGPYRYVRNPMAIAGIGQGLAVGLLYGSIPICAYALLGALVWHWVVRPYEEKNLSERFGPEYDEYRQRVSCWVPRSRY